jgi:hypothetical protein
VILDRRELATAPRSTTAAFSISLVFLSEVQVGNVQESCLSGPNVYEGGLNARKHGVDLPEEDVAKDPILVGAVKHDLDQFVVFTERDPRFLRVRAHEDFSPQSVFSNCLVGPLTLTGTLGVPGLLVAKYENVQPRRPPSSGVYRAQWSGVVP